MPHSSRFLLRVSCFSRINTPGVVANFWWIPRVLKTLGLNISASFLGTFRDEINFQRSSFCHFRRFPAQSFTVLGYQGVCCYAVHCAWHFCMYMSLLVPDYVNGTTTGVLETKLYEIPSLISKLWLSNRLASTGTFEAWWLPSLHLVTKVYLDLVRLGFFLATVS